MGTELSDLLKAAVHPTSLDAATGKGAVPGSLLSLRPWEELPEWLKESNRA